ncbi:MAG: hypothetical protein AAFW74_11365, partial [Pseudomonadota bacterium]
MTSATVAKMSQIFKNRIKTVITRRENNLPVLFVGHGMNMQGIIMMNKTILAASAALLAFASPAKAADFERDIGLIVSGVVDQWVGVQFIDEQNADDDTVLATGGEGLLSLPLGDNLSIQSDVKYEYNDFAFNDDLSPLTSQFSFQGATHLSWRDPSSALFGVFGGAGTSHANNFVGRQDFRFVGGEGQFY